MGPPLAPSVGPPSAERGTPWRIALLLYKLPPERFDVTVYTHRHLRTFTVITSCGVYRNSDRFRWDGPHVPNAGGFDACDLRVETHPHTHAHTRTHTHTHTHTARFLQETDRSNCVRSRVCTRLHVCDCNDELCARKCVLLSLYLRVCVHDDGL